MTFHVIFTQANLMMLRLNPTSHYGKIISKFLNLCDCMYTNTEETLYCRQSKVHKIYQDTLKVKLNYDDIVTDIFLSLTANKCRNTAMELSPYSIPAPNSRGGQEGHLGGCG